MYVIRFGHFRPSSCVSIHTSYKGRYKKIKSKRSLCTVSFLIILKHRIYIYIYTYTHTYTFYFQLYIYMYTYTHTHTHTHIYIYIYTYIYIYKVKQSRYRPGVALRVPGS